MSQEHVLFPMKPEPLQEKQSTKEEAYSWSIIRVAEGIAINLGSFITIAIVTAVVAFLPSVFLLFTQHVFNYLVIPTHWLEVLAWCSGAILFTLLILASIAFYLAKKHPGVVGMLLLGVLLGMYLENKLHTNKKKETH